LTIYNALNMPKFQSRYREVDDLDAAFIDAFLAYSINGTVEANGVIYANYGSVDDFLTVEELLGSLEGKICMVRYGQVMMPLVINSA